MNGNDERDYSEEAYNRDTMSNPEGIPLPEGCDGTDVSWHGSRPECQGTCGRTTYDDYDANSTENAPEQLTNWFIGLIETDGPVIKADLVVKCRDQEHAESEADRYASLLGAHVDAIYEVG